MNKSLIPVIGATGVALSAAPTTFLMSEGDGQFLWPDWDKLKLFDVRYSSDIKRKYKEVDCLKERYNEGNEWKGETQEDASPSLTSIKESASDLKGCLIVENYKQKNNSSNVWRGELKLIWSVSTSQEGFVTSLNANTRSGKLMVDASAYILEKKESSWNLKYKYENSSKTIADTQELNDHFPKSENVTIGKGPMNYWGFSPDISKICNSYWCSEDFGSLVAITLHWKKEDNKETITNWSGNFDTWFDKLFPKWSGMKNTLKNLKGTWEIKTQVGKGWKS